MSLQISNILEGHRAAVYGLCCIPDSSVFFSGSGDGWVVQWDLDNTETGKVILHTAQTILCLSYIAPSHTLLVGTLEGEIIWVPLSDPANFKKYSHHAKGTFNFYVLEDFVYSVGADGILSKWDISQQRCQSSIQLSHKSLRSIDYHPEKKTLLIGASDSNIYEVGIKNLDFNFKIDQAHVPSVFTAKYLREESCTIISGGRDALLKKWNLNLSTKEAIRSIPAHWFTINAIAIHPKEPIFATASRDKSVRIWHKDDFKLLHSFSYEKDNGHRNSVNNLMWAKEGKKLISTGDDRRIIVSNWQSPIYTKK